jgi:Zn-dependent metalloprotease
MIPHRQASLAQLVFLLAMALSLGVESEELRLIPLPTAPLSRSPTQAMPSEGRTPPRVAEVARRIGRRAGALPSPSARAPKTVPLLGEPLKRSPPHPAAAPSSPLAAAEKPGIAFNALGAPRRIKRAGKILQAAVGKSGANPGRRRDEDTVWAFLRDWRPYLRLEHPDDELQLTRNETDALGRRHFRFSQRYHGLQVWPAELIVHLDPDGHVDLMTGGYVPTPRKIPQNPIVDGETAIAKARVAVPQGERANVESARLIVHAATDRPARLAWKIDLDIAPDAQWRAIVDALNGQILSRYNTVPDEAVVGSGTDAFGNSQNLNLWLEANTYYLLDTSKPMFDPLSNPPGAARGAIQILDARNLPNSANPDNLPLPKLAPVTANRPDGPWIADAVSAAVNFSLTYDYYFSRLQRNSMNGAGGSIRAVVRYGNKYDNAFWNSDNQTMFFGDAEPFSGALDVVAHELTHGVTDYSARLEYLDQSGALNEAFSDIFGEMVEAYALGSNDWRIGESLGEAIRDLKNPASLLYEPGLPYPAKMSEYRNIPDDNGGVHFNSSIVNHAYYLLAEGLDGAIGRADAERIFYRALTALLSARSDFGDARLACVQAAEELFGADSAQAQRTAQAFDAVEILAPDAPIPTPPPIQIQGDDSVVFVYYEPAQRNYFLARREALLNDPDVGTRLSLFPVGTQGRPSATADGETAMYVNAFNDICFVDTAGRGLESCVGLDFVHAAVMSPDGRHFAYLLLDADGNLEKTIYYLNTETGQAQSFDLVAPASEGQTIDSIAMADAMDISLNNRYLVYDALNVLALEDGSNIGAWSIYAFDLFTGARLTVVPPMPGYDIDYPSFGKTSSSLMAFQAVEQESGKTTLWTGNLETGELANLGEVPDAFAVPAFGGDDRALIYSTPDPRAPTGYSLWRLPLREDHLAAEEPAQPWLIDGVLGTIYRRGALTYLEIDKRGGNLGGVYSDVEGIACGVSCSALYPPGTQITLRARPDYGAVFAGWGATGAQKSACRGKIPECVVTVDRAPVKVAARFAKSPRVALAVKVDLRFGGGRVTSLPIGIDCGVFCQERYVKGTQIVLRAQPDAGSAFAGWGGACKKQGLSDCKLTLSASRQAIARFETLKP